MYKKKEILIIVLLLAITVLLASLPTIVSKTKKEEVSKEESNYIVIHLEGEINCEPKDIQAPKGASYGYLLEKIEIYFNPYSVKEKSMQKKYYEDTTLHVNSIDIRKDEINETQEGKVKISTASFDELVGLYGIGEKRATSIIEYRKANSIDSWESLRSLLGVSNEVIETIKEKAIL